MTRIGDLGEFGTIARIRSWLETGLGFAAPSCPGRLGDDVAVVVPPAGRELLLTNDVQVAGRHFLPACMTPEEIGRRALEVNLSDIAASGGRPLWVLVSLGLPASFLLSDLEGIYRGLLEGLAAAARPGDRVGAPDSAPAPEIVGGNLSSADPGQWFLDLMVIGSCRPGHAALRSGARPGDRIFVTGSPGSAAAGLDLLRASAASAGIELDSAREIAAHVEVARNAARLAPDARRWIDAFLRPRARTVLGPALAEAGLVHAMIDVSDGILGDLSHVCEASMVSARLDLDALAFGPVDRAALRECGVRAPDLPWSWILGPSDDYELLFTAPESAGETIRGLAAEEGLLLREVGEVFLGQPGLLLRGGPVGSVERPWTGERGSGGWDHF